MITRGNTGKKCMKNKIKFLLVLILLAFASQLFAASKTISITIDDVPNTKLSQADGAQSELLNSLDSLAVPFTIFINEHNLKKTGDFAENLNLLASWLAHANATVGNHTYSHLRYSEAGFDAFTDDIEKGEQHTAKLSLKHNKDVRYFRFPFNDLGADEEQHTAVYRYLEKKGYKITPFTIESADWMFDVVYRHYQDNGMPEQAQRIGELYVAHTLQLVRFFEQLSQQLYGRQISHIYLCHDNAINTDFLDDIIAGLKNNDYQIVSLDKSLQDRVYDTTSEYYKRWGISWIYRWMNDPSKRLNLMRQEPALNEDFVAEYKRITGS
jgi:peptidoglycan-N-acetylglucosamine deacetylase